MPRRLQQFANLRANPTARRRPDRAILATPTSVQATGGFGAISVSWSHAAAASVSYFRVMRQAASGPWEMIARATVSPYSDTAVSEGVTYTYKILAVGSTTSLASTTASASVTTATPVWDSIASTNTQTSLAWDAIGGVDGYHVERGATTRGPWLRLASNQAGTTYDDTTATAGRIYAYRIRPVIGGTTGSPSAVRLGMRAVVQTSVFDATAITDAWFAEDAADTNNGASSLISLKYFSTVGSDRRALLKVATNGTPASGPALTASTVVTASTLTLYVASTSTSTRSYEAHTLASGNHDWVESEVTWNNRRSATAWAGSAGGETVTTDYHSGAVGSWTYTANEAAGTQKQIALTGSNVSSQIVNGALHLLLSRTTSGSGAAPDFRSSESSTTAERPTLTVQWYEPWSDLGTVRYVSPSGSNAANGQSSGTAWQTLTYALQQITPGTVLWVAGGTYEESPQLSSGSTDSGTALRPVVIRAVEGERPWIAGALKVNDAHYWFWDGISVDGTSVAYDPLLRELILMRNSDYWTWQRSEIKSKTTANTQASGSTGGFKALLSVGGTNPTVRYCHVHHNPGLNPSVTADGDGNAVYQDHLLYVEGGAGAVIEYNRLHHAPNGRAVKVGASSGGNPDPTNVAIRYCTIYECPGPDPLRYSYGTSGNTIDACIIGGATVNDGSGTGIVSTHSPDGSGTMVTITNTWGWDTSGGSTTMVGGSQTNVVEGSGNTFGTDPLLDSNDAPGHVNLMSGGLYTAGHLSGLASAADFPI